MMDKKLLEDSIKLLEESKTEGYSQLCLGCKSLYKKKPTQNYEDGHGGRLLEMCNRCGSDLFEGIDETIARFKTEYNKYQNPKSP